MEKLKEFEQEATAWYHLLRPVISRFVRAFDNPEAKENIEFWQKVAHYDEGASGLAWVTGWINVFCVFDDKGKWTGYPIGNVGKI